MPLATRSLRTEAASALVIVIATVNSTLKVSGEVSKFGANIPVSAMGVVMKVSQIMTSVVLGLASGILPVISYNNVLWAGPISDGGACVASLIALTLYWKNRIYYLSLYTFLISYSLQTMQHEFVILCISTYDK